MMLSRRDAIGAAHAVAAWIAFERQAGAFHDELYWEQKTGFFWHVDENLGGSCGIASVILCVALRSRGTRCGIVNHHNAAHVLVATECGKLIDATASQFGHDGPTVERMRNAFMSPFAAGASPEMVMLAHDRYDMPYRVHPSWPVYHADTITRILTRMGVDWRTP